MIDVKFRKEKEIEKIWWDAVKVADGHIVGIEDSFPCGFAWVVVKPGTSRFCRWLRKHDYARKHYYGGISIWAHPPTQSVHIKDAWCTKLASELKKSFPELDFYPQSRLD